MYSRSISGAILPQPLAANGSVLMVVVLIVTSDKQVLLSKLQEAVSPSD